MRAHRFDIVERESRGEDGETPQDVLFTRRQQVVAPVDGHPQRLMPRQRGAAPSGEEGEAVTQTLEDLLHAEDPGSDRRELNCQRQAVETPAHGNHSCLVRTCQDERAGCRGCPLREQNDRFVLSHLVERFGSTFAGQFEWRHGDHVFARHLERLPAGGDHADVRSGTKGLSDELSSRIENVLAVVEHQQQLFVPPEGPQDLQRLHAGLVTEVNCCKHGAGHEGRIAHLGEFDQPGAVAKSAREVGRGTQCEPGLPHAPGSNEGDESGHRELRPDLGEFATTAHEARRLGGQIARTLPWSRHGEFEATPE